jgi:ribosomal protein S18 acetylase RimI-like enzyme
VAGVWLFPRVWCGLSADIDNFVVDQAYRSQQLGKRMLDHCLAYAKAQGAQIATLDTFVDNPASHRFYFREGFTIRGYHFVKPLQGQSIW